MINLILFGPPGSGKGTQAENLIERYNLVHISTGDLLRQEIANKTPLGLEAQSSMNQGILVPDEVVIGMISSKLDANPDVNGFIFDGFPRTIAQAEALDKLLKFKGNPISGLLSLLVGEEELITRLLKRGETSNRPDDRNEDVIRKRIEEYRSKTFPVADYYDQQSLLTNIPGEDTIEATFDLLKVEVDKLD